MDAPYKIMLLGLLFVILNISGMARALHITNLVVPTIMSTKEATWLECDWDTDDDKIYAVKWYLGLDEFYRWAPAATPPTKTFPIIRDPIAVDLSNSKMGKVRIHNFTLEAAGVYRCEVSAEAPSFHTESKISSMVIYDLPDFPPKITGALPSYQRGELVTLNCSSPLSNPKANITFFVNDEQADVNWLTSYRSIEDYGTALETAVLGLRFPLRDTLLRRGQVSIKCVAEMSPLYWDSSEIFIHVDAPYHASIMEGRASSAWAMKSVFTTVAVASVTHILFL